MNNLPHNYSKLLSLATLVLIIAGGLVTSTDSGLSVPDWPLSYGQFFPPMVGGIRFEHTHRVIAAVVGILTVILSVILFLKETRRWVRWLGVGAVFAVVLQAVLGGLTVIYLLPTAVSVSHACLGQTFFTLVTCLALVTSKEWKERAPIYSARASAFKRLLAITLAFAYAQLILGAVVRHTEGGAVNYHIVLALLITLHIFFILIRVLRDPALQAFSRHAIGLTILMLLQIFFGIGSFVLKFMVEPAPYPRTSEVLITTVHQSAGALILAGTALLLFRALRRVKQA